MKYTIGIGVLFDESTHNLIRDIELRLAKETKNFAGLGQPPHVTVKRPFDVDKIKDIHKCQEIMNDLAARSKPFNLKFSGIGNFSDKVLYLHPIYNENLVTIHNELVDEIETIRPGSKGTREGENIKFHSTLAMDLTTQQFLVAEQYLGSLNLDLLNFTAQVQRIGLFLGIDHNTHWAVIAEKALQDH